MIGLVLAGGLSSRLGQDKTRVVHEGETLLERTATLLQRHTRRVVISCRNAEAMGSSWPVIVDETERIGPVGGIITALKRYGEPVFALACDLPFMQDAYIARLVEAREARPPACVITTWRMRDSDFIESLVAIYEPEALPLLEAGVARGFFKLARLIPSELRHSLEYGEEEKNVFFNVNRPEDLLRLKEGPLA